MTIWFSTGPFGSKQNESTLYWIGFRIEEPIFREKLVFVKDNSVISPDDMERPMLLEFLPDAPIVLFLRIGCERLAPYPTT